MLCYKEIKPLFDYPIFDPTACLAYTDAGPEVNVDADADVGKKVCEFFFSYQYDTLTIKTKNYSTYCNHRRYKKKNSQTSKVY